MKSELIKNADRLHTTELGMERLRKNLSLGRKDPVAWCRARILNRNAMIIRKGKNWYVHSDGCVITINAGSYTIITAHREE